MEQCFILGKRRVGVSGEAFLFKKIIRIPVVWENSIVVHHNNIHINFLKCIIRARESTRLPGS